MVSQLSFLIKDIVKIASVAGEGHIASSLSVLDILWILYNRVLTINPRYPKDPDRDRLIVSKGHASLGLYVVLAHKGFFDISTLSSFAKFSSILGGHPDCNKVPGVEVSTGSLGHGFPVSVGIAMALKIQKKKARVYTIIGDGEANEGTIWESILLASHHNLSNLCCIVDYNHSTDRALRLGDLAAKFNAFEWETCIVNGHDHNELYRALIQFSDSIKPYAIIANTIKGHGCTIMENNPEWHHKAPNEEELMKILETIEYEKTIC